MKILLVEDDTSTANFIIRGLSESGFIVDHTTNGLDGFSYATSISYDLVIIDIMIPRLNGFELLEELRKNRLVMPILILTARNAVEDRVLGLNSGADDYLTKPFAFDELLARANALLRRPPIQETQFLSVGHIHVDMAKRSVKSFGQIVSLRPKEFMLLSFLMRHANQVLTRTQIGEHVWNLDFYNESNVIDVYIGILRKKLEDEDHKLIHTVRGIGYIFGESQDA